MMWCGNVRKPVEAEVGTEVPNRAARAATLSASEGGKPNRSARFCFASARSSDLGSIATGAAAAAVAAAVEARTSEDFVSLAELEGVEEAAGVLLVGLDTELVVAVAAAAAAAGFVAAAN